MEPAVGMQVTPSVKLVSPLDTGGMGSVWLAEQTGLKQTVVVKFMLGELDVSGAARARFAREAAAAAAVKSPHVVQMLDHGTMPDGTPFIVMEHLEGRDLGDELREKGALPPAIAVAIVTQLAKALSKAHAAGVLHRDIKPPNIFLCKGEDEDELFVKLLDFGIAKSRRPEEATLDGDTKTGQVVGTPFYMSPEQVTAQKEIDLRSDLWSLAVVAFEILTGERPFDGPSFGALAVKIATGAPPKPSAVNPALPPAVDAWFAKACARAPEERFASAKELAEKLRASFEGFVSLPPLSPAMIDSGPRDASLPPASRTPVSIDPDAGSRPSFALASTVDQKSTPPPSSLARSEGGTSPVALESKREPSRDERRGPSRTVIALAVVGIGGALLAAYVAGGSTKDTPVAGSASPRDPSATPSAPSTPASAPPSATNLGEVTPPASAETANAVASASASASAQVTKDAGAPAHTAAAPATTRPIVVAPRPSASATPSAKPSATGRPPRPPASGEIDVY